MQYLLTEEEYQEYKRLRGDSAIFDKEKLRRALTKTGQSFLDTIKKYETPHMANREAINICRPLYEELKNQGLI